MVLFFYRLLVCAGVIFALSAPCRAEDHLTEDQARSDYRLPPGSDANLVQVTPSPLDRFDTYFVNPFVAHDMGLSPKLNQIPTTDYRNIMSWFVHTSLAGRQVERTWRDGRAVYAGYVPVMTFQGGNGPSLQRVTQKGDLTTGQEGGHSDGKMDAVEALVEMVYGEILHRHGVYTTRGLAAARVRGDHRSIEGNGQTAEAGAELRIGDRSRFLDETRVPSYFKVMDRSVPDWGHPLIVSGLGTLNTHDRARLIDSVNMGIIKDLWGLHGSFNNENRAEAASDLATFSFLREPNPFASVPGGTGPYSDEIKAANASPRSLFYDTFAFHQLRRLGLPDSVILEHFFEKKSEGNPAHPLVLYRAKPQTLEMAKAISILEGQDGGLVDSLPNAPFKADERKQEGTEYRVIFNTRRLLRELIAEPDKLRNGHPLSDADIRGLLDTALNPDFQGKNPMDGKLSILRSHCYQSVRTIESALRLASDYITDHKSEIQHRQNEYPIEQTLPARHQVFEKAEAWLRDPMSFGPDFIRYIENFDAPELRAKLAEFYRTPHPIIDGTAKRLFDELVQAQHTGICIQAYDRL